MHDVALIGAGPVGATLALALVGHDLDVVALDARAPGEMPRGDRTLALSHGARLILERLGVWGPLSRTPDAITRITTIDVSQAGGFGTTRMHAHEHRIEALGYVVSYAALQDALDARLHETGAAVRFGANVERVEGDVAAASIGLTGGQTLDARLAVVADGTGTSIAGIRRVRHDYEQVALVASVWTAQFHDGVAYERFTPEGPIALLPQRDHYGLVWTMRPGDVDEMLARDERSFLDILAHRFGSRVTGFRAVASRRAFPLALEYARPIVAARTALAGNAAQQLHPVAGQGFNLGLRDAWTLAQVVLDTPRAGIGTPSMLAEYARRRALDRDAGIAFTHGLVRAFGSDTPLMRWPRGIALAFLDSIPIARRAFTRTLLYGLR